MSHKPSDWHYSYMFRKSPQTRVMQDLGYTHVYLGRTVPGYHGQACRVLSRNGVLAQVQFRDGALQVVPQGCVRRPR
jgi:hypothetical protein